MLLKCAKHKHALMDDYTVHSSYIVTYVHSVLEA